MADPPPNDDYFVQLRADAGGDPVLPPPPAPRPAPSRTLSVAMVLTLTTVVGLALTAVVVLFVQGGDADPGGAPSVAASPGELATGTAGRATVVEDGFALWARRDDGTPVRWNPCEPIAWVFNPDGAPPNARVDIEEALGRVAHATGLGFEFLGATTEAPSRERRLLQEEAYGDRWAPVLFAWVDAGTTSLPLASTERGAAVPVAVSSPDGNVFVSGQIVLNASSTLNAGFEDRHASWGATLLHELGHLVGLDHVEDRSQLMYPTATYGAAQYSAGDLRGLAAVGAAGGCLDVPPAQDLEVEFGGFEH